MNELVERRVQLIKNALLHLPIREAELQFAARQVELAIGVEISGLQSTVQKLVAAGNEDVALMREMGEVLASKDTAISDLQAEVERLRGALKPFATAADDAERLVGHDGPMGQYIAFDDLCAARSALGPKP